MAEAKKSMIKHNVQNIINSSSLYLGKSNVCGGITFFFYSAI